MGPSSPLGQLHFNEYVISIWPLKETIFHAVMGPLYKNLVDRFWNTFKEIRCQVDTQQKAGRLHVRFPSQYADILSSFTVSGEGTPEVAKMPDAVKSMFGVYRTRVTLTQLKQTKNLPKK